MKKRSLLTSVLAVTLAATLVACSGGTQTPAQPAAEEASGAEETAEEAPAEEAAGEEAEATEGGNDTMVYATSTFGQKFSPFTAVTAYDMEVVDLTNLLLLKTDRGGAVIMDGINGETVTYDGTDYSYEGPGSLEIVQNDDGTVDYNLTMREDIVFSDGEPANIDDVIFGIYVKCDPTYDGSSTIYAMPIEGMEEYRSGMDSLANLIIEAGPDGYKETEFFTEEQYNAFWEKVPAAFAQEIVDYCAANGYVENADDVKGAAEAWGFELEDGATAQDFWDKMMEQYEGDVVTLTETETAGSTLAQIAYAELGEEEYSKGIETGESAPNISGIERTGDYSMTIHMTEYDAPAVYQMVLDVPPLHYYGDKSAYDYENNKFGFTKGDLSGVKAKNTQPLGAGFYKFVSYSNGVVTLEANENYYLGEPKVKRLLLQEGIDSDYVPGILTGTYDIASPSINDDVLNAIKDANGGELSGDTLTTWLIDYRGYGYLGINADIVNIDGKPGSDESKALRKGLMTVLAVYRDTAINSYYGDRASVIQYPISNTSWAAPQPADEGYKTAYSVDVDGNDIYTSTMTEEDRFKAALDAAVGYFKAAGFTFDEASGKFTDMDTVYEIFVAGQGEGDHPAIGIITAASDALKTIGVSLQLNDVVTSVWNDGLEGNTHPMWCAAWQSTVDPDMTQVYHSTNAHGKGTNSNHYQVDDADLDQIIVDARKSADTEYRKSAYRDAMDIIMDWGVELPLYQRKDCTVASTERVVTDSVPGDMTPYYTWLMDAHLLEVK